MSGKEPENKSTIIERNRSHVRRNYIFNVAYQIVLAIAPLITSSYLSRTLTASGTGIFSYCTSLVSYFTIFAAFGFANHGQRAIAKCQGDKQAQSNLFWEIVVVRLISVACSLGLLYSLLFCGVFGDYSKIIAIVSLETIAVVFDITFFFQGREEFGKLSLRNITIKVISVALVFILVKSSNDLWIYTLIVALSTFISASIMWVYLPKMVCRHRGNFHVLQHLRTALRFFLPTIAVTITAYVDKLMIGLLIPGETTEIITLSDGTTATITKKIADIENGYYYYADKIVFLCLTFLTSLGSVMGSRNAQEFADSNLERVQSNVYRSTSFVSILSCGMTFGLLGVAPLLANILLGQEFEASGQLMMILSPLIILTGFCSLFGYHFLIPAGEENKYTIAVFAATVVNLLLNWTLIPLLFSKGAAIASVTSIFAQAFVLIIFVSKKLSLSQIGKRFFRPLVSGAVMFAAVFGFNYLLPKVWWSLIIEIIGGAALYFGFLLLLREPYLKTFFGRFFSRKALVSSPAEQDDVKKEENPDDQESQDDSRQ